MSAFSSETVLEVHHWNETLFSFKTTRDAALRFRNGHFVMIGLTVDGKPLVRAYSIASANYEEQLEFLSIKVPDGPLTSRLQHLKPGDTLLVGRKPTGTLVIDDLKPARNLYLFGSGTGLAPFMSIIRDPDTYERFEQVIVTHTCRDVAELTYSRNLIESLKDDPLVGDLVGGKLALYTTTTREAYPNMGRITTLIETGKLFADLGVPPLDPSTDRAMMCGSNEMIQDVKALMLKAGLMEGSNAAPAEFVIEKAFAG